MAVRSFKVTVSSNGAAPIVAGLKDPVALAATAQTDITTALAVAAISGNGPATTAVTLVQTDVTAVQTAIAGDVVLLVDTTVVTTKNGLLTALDALKRAIEGSNLLT